MVKGYLHSVESFGTVDGPGIRFVAFLQGCPMRCKYCHNPDTWGFGSGEEITPEELAKKAFKYKSYINRGGVTVTGGEPLMQIEFVTEFFRLIKAEGLHTAADTSGITFNIDSEKSVEAHRKLLEYTDLVLLDIKHIDDGEHRKLTGKSNKNTLDFAKYLSDNGKDIWIRHVLVPEITDRDEYLIKLKEFIDSLKTVKKVEILPYHTMGAIKYEKLGIDYPLKGIEPPTRERVENAKRILTLR